MAKNHLNTPDEIWKDIPGFPGYEVSDQGRVRSYWQLVNEGEGYIAILQNAPQRILRPGYIRRYPRVGLRKNLTTYVRFVARLVLLAFVGPCPQGMQACHGDGIRTNCFLENLRWDTPKGNYQDRYKHGTEQLGKKNPSAKLSEHQVIDIRNLHNKGLTQTEIAKRFNVSQVNIGLIVNRKNWQHI
jgi:hypothetical protein